MSGTVIRVIEDSHYDFVDLGATGMQSILCAQRIDASQFREGGLLVRVLKINMASSATDDIQVVVYEDAWDPFSGSIVFQATNTTGTVAAVPTPLLPTTLNPYTSHSPPDPPTDPYALFFPLTAPFGGLLQVYVIGTRSGGTAGTALDIQLNADLILKD